MNSGHQQHPVGAKARWRPGWRMTLFALVMVPVLVRLGFWQLDREQQKLAAYALLEARASTGVAQAPRSAPLSMERDGFSRVQVIGRFEPSILFLDNQVDRGRVGYWVLQSFSDRQGDQWLVNRGFVAAEPDRNRWPQIATPSNEVTLTGVLWPELGRVPLLTDDFSEIAPNSTDGWPRRVQRLDMAVFRTWMPNLRALELRLVPESTALVGPAALTELPNDAPRHRAYAVQWFGLAGVLMIGMIVFGHIRGRDVDRDGRSGALTDASSAGARGLAEGDSGS
ncbi:MAG: SURF1 family protein [Pseudomonadota bacterium]